MITWCTLSDFNKDVKTNSNPNSIGFGFPTTSIKREMRCIGKIDPIKFREQTSLHQTIKLLTCKGCVGELKYLCISLQVQSQ